MANMNLVREALIKLMRAGDENTATPGRDIYAPDQVANPGAVLGSTDDNLRQARQQAREVQGTDPLKEFPEGGYGALSQEDKDAFSQYVINPRSGLRQDARRLPDVSPEGVIREQEIDSLFEFLMDEAAGGVGNIEAFEARLARLKALHPEFAKTVEDTVYDSQVKELRRAGPIDSNSLLDDEIPF
jgi:hypothetical protein